MRSLSLERLAPTKERQAFLRRWVYLNLIELACLGDRLRYLQEGEAREEDLAEVRARARALLEGLAWSGDRVLLFVWQFIETEVARPEDAWAPAQVLQALEPGSERTRRYLERLAPAQRAPALDSP